MLCILCIDEQSCKISHLPVVLKASLLWDSSYLLADLTDQLERGQFNNKQ